MLLTNVKLFHLIFNSGIINESWAVGAIKSFFLFLFFKGGGEPRLPGNYLPIALLSCFG